MCSGNPDFIVRHCVTTFQPRGTAYLTAVTHTVMETHPCEKRKVCSSGGMFSPMAALSVGRGKRFRSPQLLRTGQSRAQSARAAHPQTMNNVKLWSPESLRLPIKHPSFSGTPPTTKFFHLTAAPTCHSPNHSTVSLLCSFISPSWFLIPTDRQAPVTPS